MADAVDRPKNDGRLRLPPVDGAMNRIAPKSIRGGKGSKDDDKNVRLGIEADEEAEIILRARKFLDVAASEEAENRKNGLDDQRHETGEGQWPQDVAAQRNFDKRPMLTLNKHPTFVHQVTNDIRQNRPGIHYSPVGERSDRDVAKMIDGLVRQIWRNSVADIALDTATENAVGAPGWGYIRVNTDWVEPKSFDLDLTIERICNPFSVYPDPRCTSPTGAGMKKCMIIEDMSREDFEAEYPDADPMPWTTYGIGDTYKSWVTEKTIRRAEYFEVEIDTRTLVQLSTGSIVWKDELDDTIKAMIDQEKITIVNERESDCQKVMWYKLSAVDILEHQEWPGAHIPIVKFVGNEKWIEGKVKLSGIIRNAKQPQLMYNYMNTLEVETIAQQPKITWLIAEGQDEGYEEEWRTAHTVSRPALKYRPIALGGQAVPPPQRQQPFGVPAGIVQAIDRAAQDMQAVTGIRFDATLRERVYDESGRALRELRERSDMGSFHYIDNVANSLRQLGEILKDLIINGRIYETRRVVTILREDDTEERAILDPAAPKALAEIRDEQTGKPMKVFNPTIGKYGVQVTIGPSYATKRIEAAEEQTEFLKLLGPQLVPLVADIIVKNKDWNGAEELAKRLASQVPPQFMSANIKDVPPQVQAVMQNLSNQVRQLSEELQLAQRQIIDQDKDRAIKLEKIEKDFEAKLLQVAQKADASQLQQLIEEVAALRETLASPPEFTH